MNVASTIVVSISLIYCTGLLIFALVKKIMLKRKAKKALEEMAKKENCNPDGMPKEEGK